MSIYDEARLIEMFYDYFREIPSEYNLSFFLRFSPKSYYSVLKAHHKANIENCVLQGIENGKLNYMTGKVSGKYSVASTWAVEFMDLFEAKEQIIAAVRQHALKSPLSQNYVIWYFHDYVTLDKEENLEYYKNIFGKKKNLRKIDYDFLRTFIIDERSKLYETFRELIDRYENKRNLTEESRLPEIDELFGGKI